MDGWTNGRRVARVACPFATWKKQTVKHVVHIVTWSRVGLSTLVLASQLNRAPTLCNVEHSKPPTDVEFITHHRTPLDPLNMEVCSKNSTRICSRGHGLRCVSSSFLIIGKLDFVMSCAVPHQLSFWDSHRKHSNKNGRLPERLYVQSAW